jgi:hypothetical protein
MKKFCNQKAKKIQIVFEKHKAKYKKRNQNTKY